HLFCQTTGLFLAFCGAGVIMLHKYQEHDGHLSGWHERLGAFTLVLCVVQGTLGLRLQSLPHNRFTIQLIIQLSWLHRILGTILLIISHLALLSGVWQYYHHGPSALKMTILFAVPMTVLVV